MSPKLAHFFYYPYIFIFAAEDYAFFSIIITVSLCLQTTQISITVFLLNASYCSNIFRQVNATSTFVLLYLFDVITPLSIDVLKAFIGNNVYKSKKALPIKLSMDALFHDNQYGSPKHFREARIFGFGATNSNEFLQRLHGVDRISPLARYLMVVRVVLVVECYFQVC